MAPTLRARADEQVARMAQWCEWDAMVDGDYEGEGADYDASLSPVESDSESECSMCIEDSMGEAMASEDTEDLVRYFFGDDDDDVESMPL